MQYYAVQCNTLQYHASLITADGAYHCPVGSIMAIFIILALFLDFIWLSRKTLFGSAHSHSSPSSSCSTGGWSVLLLIVELPWAFWMEGPPWVKLMARPSSELLMYKSSWLLLVYLHDKQFKQCNQFMRRCCPHLRWIIFLFLTMFICVIQWWWFVSLFVLMLQ